MTTGRQPGVASDNKPDTELHDEAGDFLARWSRRKLEARTGSIDDSAEVLQTEEPQAVPPVAAPPERELTDADMPPLDSLTADSDFTPFMSPGVSDGLRRLALRKLFSQPAFNITDGLNDYDEDFTQFAGLGNIVTHEMKRLLRREQAAAEEASFTEKVKPLLGTNLYPNPEEKVKQTVELLRDGEPFGVDVDGQIPDRLRRPRSVTIVGVHDPGVVEYHVDAAECLLGGSDHGCRILMVGDVSDQGDRGAAGPDHLGPLLLGHVPDFIVVDGAGVATVRSPAQIGVRMAELLA